MKDKLDKVRNDSHLLELFKYSIFGLITTVVNVAVYQLLLQFFDYRISNLVAILTSKIFAYTTNKLFVFHSKCANTKELMLEMLRFIIARGATGLFDYFGLIFAVDIMSFDRIRSKYVIQIIVIIMNFILGKKAVFLSKTEN